MQSFVCFLLVVIAYKTEAQIPSTQCACSQIEQCINSAQAQEAQIASACTSTCAQSYFGASQGQSVAQCYSTYSQSKMQLMPQERQCFYQATQMCTGASSTSQPQTTPAGPATPNGAIDPIRQLVTLVPQYRQFMGCLDTCVMTNGTTMQLSKTNSTSGRRKRSISGTHKCASQNQCYLNTGINNNGKQLAACLGSLQPQMTQMAQTKCTCLASALNLGNQVSCTPSQSQQQKGQWWNDNVKNG